MADLETETPQIRPRRKQKEALARVQVRITKFGAGKVSTGEHVAGEGDIYCDRGELLEVTEDVANTLESQGFGEIYIPPPPPPPPPPAAVTEDQAPSDA